MSMIYIFLEFVSAKRENILRYKKNPDYIKLMQCVFTLCFVIIPKESRVKRSRLLSPNEFHIVHSASRKEKVLELGLYSALH